MAKYDVYQVGLAVALLILVASFALYGTGTSVTGYAAKSAIYKDVDGDGYGNPATVKYNVRQSVGYVLNGLDCNDNNKRVKPGINEVCKNKIDDNCNGLIDESCR